MKTNSTFKPNSSFYIEDCRVIAGCMILHKKDCPIAIVSNKCEKLGNYSSVNEAMNKAYLIFNNITKCKACFPNEDS